MFQLAASVLFVAVMLIFVGDDSLSQLGMAAISLGVCAGLLRSGGGPPAPPAPVAEIPVAAIRKRAA